MFRSVEEVSGKEMERILERIVSTYTSDSGDNGGDTDGKSSSENVSDNISEQEQSVDGDNIEKDEYPLLLRVSVEAARYLLMCSTPFHEHDELIMHFPDGIFPEIVKYIGDHNEIVRKATLENVEEINKLVSPSIQKDIVNCFAQEVLKPILEEIGDDVFALIFDEYNDKSNDKLMAVILRYVTCGIVKERFVGLIQMSEISAKFLKSAVESLLAEYGLSLKNVRGLSYDGTSDMRNEFNGLKALIMKENHSAYYVHCFAYQLQLVVVSIAKEQYGGGILFDKIAILKDLVCASCKRTNMTRESQKEKLKEAIGNNVVETESGFLKVVDACGGSHYTTLSRLVDLFSEVIDVLEYMEEQGGDIDTRYQACSLQNHFDYAFVLYLHMMLHSLGITDSLSQALERKEQDISNTMSLAKSTIRQLQKFRDDGFDLLLDEVSSFCRKHDIWMVHLDEDYVDRRSPKQKTNITIRQYFEFNCFNKIVDMQIYEFHRLFTEVSSELLTCMSTLNPRDSFCDFDLSKLMRLAEFYPDDFSSEEMINLKLQLDSYINNVKSDERFADLNGISDLAKMMVETEKHLKFPLVYRLLKLVLVLPVATATVERCLSAKDIVMSYLSDQNCDDFVCACVIPVVEKETLANVTSEDVMKRLQKMETFKEQV